MAAPRRSTWRWAMLLLPLASLPGTTRAWSLCRTVSAGQRAAAAAWPARTALRACEAVVEEGVDGEHFHAEATQLLDLLELWIREQAITDVLSRKQAANLLEELRNDRRFWAQQRRQFTRVWTSIVEGLRQETRPLSAVLGESTSSRLLDAFEEMDTEPEMVDAVVRSEVVEKMLGYVLYEGILEFIERADLLGNLVKGLPVIGPLRVQVSLARSVAPARHSTCRCLPPPHAHHPPPIPRRWRGRWRPPSEASSSRCSATSSSPSSASTG